MITRAPRAGREAGGRGCDPGGTRDNEDLALQTLL